MIGRLALAVVVAILTGLAVSGTTDDDPVRIVVLGHSAMSVVALILNVTGRRRLSAAVERIRDAEPIVATGLIEAPREDVAKRIAEVRRLGFELAGATDTTIGGPPIRTWVMLEPAGETWVEVGIALKPMAVFLSESSTGQLIETAFPLGEPIDHPRLSVRVVTTTVADAIAAHREAVASVGGSQRRVATLDDYLAAEVDQRRLTGGMRIEAHLENAVKPAIRDWAISVGVDVVALIALFAFAPR